MPTEHMSLQKVVKWIENLPESREASQLYIIEFNSAVHTIIAYGSTAVEPMIERLLHTNNRWMRWAAIWALREIGDTRAIEPLWNICKSEVSDLGILHHALVALSTFKDQRLFEILVPLLNHENRRMRRYTVIVALGNVGDPRALEFLTPLLDTSSASELLNTQLPKVNYPEARTIIEAIGKIDDLKAIQALEAIIYADKLQYCLDTQLDRLRCDAIYAVAHIDHPASLSVLCSALKHPKRGVRRSARKALSKRESIEDC